MQMEEGMQPIRWLKKGPQIVVIVGSSQINGDLLEANNNNNTHKLYKQAI